MAHADRNYSAVASWSRQLHRVFNRINTASGHTCRANALWKSVKLATDAGVISRQECKAEVDHDVSSSTARTVLGRLAAFDAPCGPFPLWSPAANSYEHDRPLEGDGTGVCEGGFVPADLPRPHDSKVEDVDAATYAPTVGQATDVAAWAAVWNCQLQTHASIVVAAIGNGYEIGACLWCGRYAVAGLLCTCGTWIAPSPKHPGHSSWHQWQNASSVLAGGTGVCDPDRAVASEWPSSVAPPSSSAGPCRSGTPLQLSPVAPQPGLNVSTEGHQNREVEAPLGLGSVDETYACDMLCSPEGSNEAHVGAEGVLTAKPIPLRAGTSGHTYRSVLGRFVDEQGPQVHTCPFRVLHSGVPQDR